MGPQILERDPYESPPRRGLNPRKPTEELTIKIKFFGEKEKRKRTYEFSTSLEILELKIS